MTATHTRRAGPARDCGSVQAPPSRIPGEAIYGSAGMLRFLSLLQDTRHSRPGAYKTLPVNFKLRPSAAGPPVRAAPYGRRPRGARGPNPALVMAKSFAPPHVVRYGPMSDPSEQPAMPPVGVTSCL